MTTREIGALSELFSITFEQTKSIDAAVAVVLLAKESGAAGIRAAIARREAERLRRDTEACRPTIASVARAAGLTEADLCGPDRTPFVTRVRYKAYRELAQEGRTLRAIAVALGRSSHSTIRAGIARLEREGRA